MLLLFLSLRLSKTDGGQLTVRCVLARRKWPEAKILEKFGKFQHLLDRDVRAMKKVDAEFGYEVIKNVCDRIFDTLSCDTRSRVALLPRYKFKICRSYGKDVLGVQQEVHKLREFVSFLYSEMDEKLQCKENNLCLVTAVLNNTVQKLESCVEDRHGLAGLRSDGDVQVLISAREELRQQYEALQVRGPFQFLTEQDQVQQFIMAPLRLGALGRGQPVLVKDLLTTTLVREDGGTADVLLIGGAPGAGKTSFCYYVLRDWCRQAQQVDGLEHVDLVLLVEWARVRGYASLNSFLMESLLRHTKAKFPEQLVAETSLAKYDVLVVIDGFSAQESKEGELLQESFQLFNGKGFLMTTDSADIGYTESAFVARNNLTSVTVSLCSLSNVTRVRLAQHACRVANSTEESRHVFKQFKESHWKGLDRVLPLCREPATVLVYAALWRPNEPPPSTPSRLHRFLLEGLYQRFLKSCHDAQRQTYRRNEARLFHQLGELAWEQLCANHHRVPQDIAKEMEVEELLPVFFTAVADDSVCPSKFTYTFASLSQQLHLSAVFLARKIIREFSYTEFLEEKLFVWERYPELLLFTVGELNHFRCGATKLMKILRLSRFTPITAEDFNYWWLMEHEAGHNPMVAQYVAGVLPARHWRLGTMTVVPGLKLLARTPAPAASLAIDVPTDIEPYRTPELMETLQEVRVALNRRVSLELHLWRHYMCRGGQPSNKLLRAFAPWCTITNFTGEIGPEADEAPVLSPHSIRTLRVRVSSPGALHTLSAVTGRLTKVCRNVWVTLALPHGCIPARLTPLTCSNLHLALEEVHEENMSWVVSVVRRVAGG